MLIIVTGLPGHGKTLNTIREVRELVEADRRSVYVNGIPDLRLPWFPLDNPEEWFKVPDGSVIVIDEAQRIFPPRPVGAPVPEKVRQFETHRHRGLDVFLVTQDAMLLDAHVRRLAGEHRHFRRVFGSLKATRYVWPEVADPKDRRDVQRAARTLVALDRKLFGVYRSATVHTVKRRIPWPVLAFPVLLVLLLVGGFFGYRTMQSFGKPPEAAPKPTPAGGLVATSSQAAAWFKDREPRVSGLEFTAPQFDEVTKPKQAPAPVAVVANRDRCRAYSQQGTRLEMPDGLCRQILERGFFVAWEEPGASRQGTRAQSSAGNKASGAGPGTRPDSVPGPLLAEQRGSPGTPPPLTPQAPPPR